MDKPKEIPVEKPIGDFIVGKQDATLHNGAWYHYNTVCTLLKEYSDTQTEKVGERLKIALQIELENLWESKVQYLQQIVDMPVGLDPYQTINQIKDIAKKGVEV